MRLARFEAAGGHPEWVVGSVGLALLATLVEAILAFVPGWSAPARVWSTAATFALGLLALHALVRAAAAGWRGDGIGALRGLGVLAGLVACLAMVAGLGVGAISQAGCGGDFDDVRATPSAPEAAR